MAGCGFKAFAALLMLSAVALSALALVGYVTPASSVVLVRGAGATFPLPQILDWIRLFTPTHPGVIVSYLGIGSGAGQAAFFEGTTDFCGSDPPLTHKAWLKHRGEVMQVPYLLGAVVVTYNLPGLRNATLRLTGKVIAMIYAGRIRYWDNPMIKALNPGLKLPHKEIVPVYRADASGTQYIFTLFLRKSAPGVWRASWVSKVAKFPAATQSFGRGGKGNPGVAEVILHTPYSIGFVEWGYTIEKGMPVAAIENAAGRFLKPSVKGLEAAASDAVKHLPKTPLGDFSRDLNYIVYSDAPNAYPIACWTHLILWTHYRSPAEAKALATFLKWVVRVGYRHILPGYAPAPQGVRKLVLKAVEILDSEAGSGG